MEEKPDGKTLAVNLHFYLTFNTMLTVIINTFLQDSSFFTAKKKREGGGKNCIRDALWTLLEFFFQKVFTPSPCVTRILVPEKHRVMRKLC